MTFDEGILLIIALAVLTSITITYICLKLYDDIRSISKMLISITKQYIKNKEDEHND